MPTSIYTQGTPR